MSKKTLFSFVLVAFIMLQAGAQNSILTKTYYLNEFNGTSVDDGNGKWTTNSTMPGAISQADGTLIVDLANTSDYGTLILTLSNSIDLTDDSRVSLEWKFENMVYTNNAVTNPELALGVYFADAGNYENGHSKATNPSLRITADQWAIGMYDPLHYNSSGSVDDQPTFKCNRAKVKYIKIAYLQNGGGKIVSGTLKIRKLEIGKRPLIEDAKTTSSLLAANTYINDFTDIHDGTHQVFCDKYIQPNENGELDLWMGSGLGADSRMFIDKLASSVDLSNTADRVFVLKGRATKISPTDGRTFGIHFYKKADNEGIGIYMNMSNSKKLRLKGPVLAINNNSEFTITVDLNDVNNYQDGTSGLGADFDWSEIGAWGLYTRPGGSVLENGHIYIDEVRIGAKRIPLDWEVDAYMPASDALALKSTPAASELTKASIALTNAENSDEVLITDFTTPDGSLLNFTAPFESGNHYTLSVDDPVYYLPDPLTFTDDGIKTAVDVRMIMSDDSSLKIRLNRLINLIATDFTLYNITEDSPVEIFSVIKHNGGEEYTLEADLPVGANYSFAIAKDGYYFGVPLFINKNVSTEDVAPLSNDDTVVSEQYYNLQGQLMGTPYVPAGIYIVRQILQSGNERVIKVLKSK